MVVVPAARCGMNRRQSESASFVSPIHETVGSKPMRVTPPLPYERSATVTRLVERDADPVRQVGTVNGAERGLSARR